jgi:hypothetical protein
VTGEEQNSVVSGLARHPFWAAAFCFAAVALAWFWEAFEAAQSAGQKNLGVAVLAIVGFTVTLFFGLPGIVFTVIGIANRGHQRQLKRSMQSGVDHIGDHS